MNERIKKCLTQAGIYDGREGLYWCSQEQLEKFAELVVVECADKLEKQKFEHFSINRVGREHYNYGLTAGATAIKEHFGVEY